MDRTRRPCRCSNCRNRQASTLSNRLSIFAEHPRSHVKICLVELCRMPSSGPRESTATDYRGLYGVGIVVNCKLKGELVPLYDEMSLTTTVCDVSSAARLSPCYTTGFISTVLATLFALSVGVAGGIVPIARWFDGTISRSYTFWMLALTLYLPTLSSPTRLKHTSNVVLQWRGENCLS